jgi:hypothetical protein
MYSAKKGEAEPLARKTRKPMAVSSQNGLRMNLSPTNGGIL